MTEDQLLNNDKRFQQIMQGSSSSSDAVWPDKHKFEKVDVKKEINKLNTSKFHSYRAQNNYFVNKKCFLFLLAYVYQSSWPVMNVKLGSVTAVSFDKAGNVVIFHRCDRLWEQDSFLTNNVFNKRKLGPIRDSTVLALDRETGKLVYEWGKNL